MISKLNILRACFDQSFFQNTNNENTLFCCFILFSVLLFGCSSKQKNDNVAKAEVQDGLNEQGIKSNSSSNIISPSNNSIQTPTFIVNERVNDVIMVYEIRGENRKFGYFDKPLIDF